MAEKDRITYRTENQDLIKTAGFWFKDPNQKRDLLWIDEETGAGIRLRDAKLDGVTYDGTTMTGEWLVNGTEPANDMLKKEEPEGE